jgi:hypothetical protein
MMLDDRNARATAISDQISAVVEPNHDGKPRGTARNIPAVETSTLKSWLPVPVYTVTSMGSHPGICLVELFASMTSNAALQRSLRLHTRTFGIANTLLDFLYIDACGDALLSCI